MMMMMMMMTVYHRSARTVSKFCQHHNRLTEKVRVTISYISSNNA